MHVYISWEIPISQNPRAWRILGITQELDRRTSPVKEWYDRCTQDYRIHSTNTQSSRHPKYVMLQRRRQAKRGAGATGRSIKVHRNGRCSSPAPLATRSSNTERIEANDRPTQERINHLVTCFLAVPTTVLFTLVANLNEHSVSPRCAPSGERLHIMSVLLEPVTRQLAKLRGPLQSTRTLSLLTTSSLAQAP